MAGIALQTESSASTRIESIKGFISLLFEIVFAIDVKQLLKSESEQTLKEYI